MPRTIRVAHSPDSDDAFMFYALAAGKIDTGDLRFVHELQDIETLNRRALSGELEVSAVSIHAYAYLSARYALLPHGASMGEGYGPRIVARRRLRPADLDGLKVAVPGTMTSAFLALKLFRPGVQHEVVPFDQIIEHVAAGKAEAGLLIHEGQLTYEDDGLTKIVDLGEWWAEQTGGLPLPLGGNIIRRDLGPGMIAKVSRLLHDSIAYALSHREAAVEYAIQFGRGLDRERTDRFVGMYVNDLTLSYGERGRRGVERLMQEAFDRGLIPQRVTVEFAA